MALLDWSSKRCLNLYSIKWFNQTRGSKFGDGIIFSSRYFVIEEIQKSEQLILKLTPFKFGFVKCKRWRGAVLKKSIKFNYNFILLGNKSKKCLILAMTNYAINSYIFDITKYFKFFILSYNSLPVNYTI